MQASIQNKLLSIVVVFLLGFVIYSTVVHRTMPSTLEESDYRDVIEMKDLVADVLPPPLYAIESLLVALQAARETDKVQLTKLRESWQKLERDYAERQSFWTQRLAPGTLRVALLETSRRGAERMFNIGDAQVWPAIEAGDAARLQKALDELESTYREHRIAVDAVVSLADKQAQSSTAGAATTISQRKLMLLALGGLITLIGGALALAVARNISRRAQHMADALRRIASGDLTERAEDRGKDELGEIAQQLNHTLDAIERVFAEVRHVAHTLADAAARLASNSDQLSHGAQQQAASLEETAASLEEITATVKQSAGNAQQANTVALGSRDVAERGGGVVAQAISAMDEITKASRRIGDIITTIDEIALQTNLLALNAAVEAARAGEQGRGFAVVASEVGNLAQRSAAAAKEVKTLIQDSLERIQAGHQLVGESGRALNDIIVSVKKVTDIVGEIAEAAREQSIGVDQVNQAVSQMDQVTQNSAGQTDQLSHTAQGLAESASHLKKLMLRFRLNGEAATAAAGSGSRNSPAGSSRRRGQGRPLEMREADHDFVAAAPANANASDSDEFEVLSSGGSHGA
jgi:methyl-accepting chemotaxis protein